MLLEFGKKWIHATFMRQRLISDPVVVVNNFAQAIGYVWGADGTQNTPLFACITKEVLLALYEKKMTLLEAEYLVDRVNNRIRTELTAALPILQYRIVLDSGFCCISPLTPLCCSDIARSVVHQFVFKGGRVVRPKPLIERTIMHASHPTESQTIPEAPTPQLSVATRVELAPDAMRQFKSGLIIIASMTLLFSFFLPWISFFGADLSGLTIQKLSRGNQLLWAIPLLAFCTVGLTLADMSSNLIRRLAGLSPYVALFAAGGRYEQQLIQQFEFGAWLALAAGAVLICLPGASPKKAGA